MSVDILDPGLGFGSLSKRSKTTYLILHHAAAEAASVEGIHKWHRDKGWAGIGYNFYIRKDGAIYKGRGWEYTGAHTSNYNSISIGICFEGNYDSTSTSMPELQYSAGVEMIALALEKYSDVATICGHKSLGSTACPGRYFPLAKMIEAGKNRDKSKVDPVTDPNGCPYGTSTETVKKGSSGKAVHRCQWYLNKACTTALTIDGICGALTVKAIKDFQIENGLMADGICGKKTWTKLESVVAAQSANAQSVQAVRSAIEILAKAGIIDTPDYWLANFYKLEYLDKLLINLSTQFNKIDQGADVQTIDAALAKLVSAGVINTPEYWINNCGKVQYVDKLLIKAANGI